MSVTTVHNGPRKVTRSAEVDAPASAVFDLVADPHLHGELDGSGTVKDTVKGPERLTSGDRFSVGMKQYGVPYRITSRVTHVAEGRAVEWRHPAGHRWRWELTPLSDTTTRVTETFDYSGINGLQARALELLGIPGQNARGIEATLRKLQARFSG